MYPTPEIAEEALINAWTIYRYGHNQGPISTYLCPDCGQYHFTSRGPMNTRLATSISEGKIKMQREANHWSEKWKNK